MTIPKNLKKLKKKELKKIAREHNIKFEKDIEKVELRKIIRKELNNLKPSDKKSKESLVIDFINSIVSIEEAIEPYKEQKKDLKKQYKENNWLDAKEQKMALQALRLIRNKDNMNKLMNYYSEIQKKIE